jgi:hypothetical protein
MNYANENVAEWWRESFGMCLAPTWVGERALAQSDFRER